MTRSPVPLLDVTRFDRTAVLSQNERDALTTLGWQLRRRRSHDAELPEWDMVGRLLAPLDAARSALCDRPNTPLHRRSAKDAVGLVLRRCSEEGTAFWGWSEDTWVGLIGEDRHAFARPWPSWVDQTVRPDVVAYSYFLCGFDAFHRLGSFNRLALAWRVFGRQAVELAQGRIFDKLEEWGYRSARSDLRLRTITAQILLINRSARLQDLTDEVLQQLHGDPRLGRRRSPFHAVHRAVAGLGFASPPLLPTRGSPMPVEGAPVEWMTWVDRWFATSTLTPEVRREYRSILAKTGRWLTSDQPHIATPADWTRDTCAAWVARVTRIGIGDYAQRRVGLVGRLGRRLAPTSMASYISATRTLLRDCQEWGWCTRRFDPATALATPRSVRAMLGPRPRVIADDIWAKILWAGLNLEADDLAGAGIRAYPLELVRALTLTWLFAGQRSDEILRLRVGCIRWQHSDGDPASPVCLLDIPVHKTGMAFTKPVDPLLGRRIEAWQAVRPVQPPMIDRKTGEATDLLFAVRANPVARTYINATIIPMLCRKAGVSQSDVRGRITSHRARATIASQLYNAKEPMTLFELQAWLGHRSPETTQHYAQITPNTLTKAYTDAGYFARNVRTIEVLIDREAVLSGAAAAGEPWQHYDIGHGYCSYTFFEQCPHRLACARCDFYIPKPSGKAQMLEAKADVDRRLALIPLTDGERAAIEQDRLALAGCLIAWQIPRHRQDQRPVNCGAAPFRQHATRCRDFPFDRRLGQTDNADRGQELDRSTIRGSEVLTSLFSQPLVRRRAASARRCVGTPLVPTSHTRHGAQGRSKAPRLLARRERSHAQARPFFTDGPSMASTNPLTCLSTVIARQSSGPITPHDFASRAALQLWGAERVNSSFPLASRIPHKQRKQRALDAAECAQGARQGIARTGCSELAQNH